MIVSTPLRMAFSWACTSCGKCGISLGGGTKSMATKCDKRCLLFQGVGGTTSSIPIQILRKGMGGGVWSLASGACGAGLGIHLMVDMYEDRGGFRGVGFRCFILVFYITSEIFSCSPQHQQNIKHEVFTSLLSKNNYQCTASNRRLRAGVPSKNSLPSPSARKGNFGETIELQISLKDYIP